jgi:hypothetical protein
VFIRPFKIQIKAVPNNNFFKGISNGRFKLVICPPVNTNPRLAIATISNTEPIRIKNISRISH